MAFADLAYMDPGLAAVAPGPPIRGALAMAPRQAATIRGTCEEDGPVIDRSLSVVSWAG